MLFELMLKYSSLECARILPIDHSVMAWKKNPKTYQLPSPYITIPVQRN